jgi:hypothetical protein
MSWKRLLAAVVVTGLGAGSAGLRAEEPPPAKPDDGKGKPAPVVPQDVKKKESYFGNRFALYLETTGGPASFKSIDNPVAISSDLVSKNTVDLSGGKRGQFTVGWTLPRERGQYLLTYTGIADGSYSLDATGYERSYQPVGGGGVQTVKQVLPWWRLHVANGRIRAIQTPPVWDPLTDDANSNGFPDLNEIRYPGTAFDLQGPVAKKLDNRIETYDLYYRREFGGVRYRARWSAGVRYLKYEGALPTPTWLKAVYNVPGASYSDGVQNQMLVLSQSTSGYGPMGSGEMQFNFLRRRLQLYMAVEVAFLIENLDSDSGPFTYLVPVTTNAGSQIYPGEGQITRSISKSAWNTKFGVGVRVRIVEGLQAFVGVSRTGYLDTLLVPTILSVPATINQVDEQAIAVYTTRDIVVTETSIGLSFQF